MSYTNSGYVHVSNKTVAIPLNLKKLHLWMPRLGTAGIYILPFQSPHVAALITAEDADQCCFLDNALFHNYRMSLIFMKCHCNQLNLNRTIYKSYVF